MRHVAKTWVATVIALLLATPLVAQTTGRITGQVVDSHEAPMPGVALTVQSPNLQGVQSTTTDSKGQFRFLALPPGTYSLKADLAGFGSIERKGIVVGIDRSVDLELKMEVASVTETITVTGESPVIDSSSSTGGVNVTAEMFERIPLGRDFYGMAHVAPGAQDDGTGTVFYGSSGLENAYIIDGLNTTGVEVGDKGKTLNFDFIQEIEIKSSGLPAEYGRMTGGVINVLTKSGGNQFKGSVFGFTEGGGLESDNQTAAKRPATTTTVADTDFKRDFGGDLGGYLMKDKLWFYGAYNRVNQKFNTTVIRELSSPGSPAVGEVIPAERNRNLFAGKLTYKISGDHTLTASVFGDPSERKGNVTAFAISGPPSTWEGTEKTGSTDYVGRYDGTFGSSFLVKATYGHHKENYETGGPGATTVQLTDRTVVPTANSGGFSFFQNQEFTRDTLKLDMSKFLGSHEIKLGGDYEKVNTVNNNFYGGGSLIYKFATGGVTYYRHRYYVNDRAAGYDRSDPSTWQLAYPLTSEPRTNNTSVYLQDSWKVARSFTLNLGVRWEQQDVQDRDLKTAFKLGKNWAPRLGFVWDAANNGKSKLYAHYGRFYENIPQDINIRAFGGEALCFCYNFDPSPSATAPDPTAPRSSSLLGGTEPVDPELRGQYIDEALGGFEYEMAPNFALGAKVSYRKLGRVIEDFLVPSEGNYFIANPGEGTLGQTLAFYDGVTTAPAPKAERKNLSLEFTARKRFSNNWQVLASYVWSKLDGNYDGLFQNSTGQQDPNINSAYDYADFLVNSTGRLSAERQHQLKFDGSYEFGGALKGLNAGLSTYWYSGLPLNAYGYSFAYSNWEYYLVPRGSVGRGPSDYEMDVHLSYPIKVGERARINVIVDAFNLFNRQAITQLDERYNLDSDDPCAGVPGDLCNGDGGLLALPNSTNPVGTIPNPRATATNPDYLKTGIETTSATAGFTGQRSIRLGVRFTF